MRALARLLLAVLLGGGAGASLAQAPQVELAPSDAVRCLAPADVVKAGPEFPFDQLKFDRDGRVKVELQFTAPALRPGVKVLESEGDAAFVEAVQSHVRQWRVPCMPEAGPPVRLVREFVFQPAGRKVFVSPLQDLDDRRRADLLACMRHVSGRMQADYPRRALREGVAGRVLVMLRFTSPGEPPQVQTFGRPSARLLQQAVDDWLPGLRMPCLSGEAITLTAVYVFRFEGDGAYGLKPLTLLDLMRATKGLAQLQLALDTSEMGCPFDLKFSYFHPIKPNGVASIDRWNAAREPLFDYLRGVELDLPAKSLDAVFADDTVITVPCLKLDLKPKE